MFWNRDPRKRRGGYWRCFVVKRERERTYFERNREAILARHRLVYENLTGPQYNWRLLRSRRNHVLARRRARREHG